MIKITKTKNDENDKWLKSQMRKLINDKKDWWQKCQMTKKNYKN